MAKKRIITEDNFDYYSLSELRSIVKQLFIKCEQQEKVIKQLAKGLEKLNSKEKEAFVECEISIEIL